ncbi:MAG: hypothetical protein ABIH26_14115 [Candidatus Eisenbacteria bacterium]
MRALAAGTLLSFRRGRGFPFAVLLLLGVAALFWITLEVRGSYLVNGVPVSLDETTRVALAIGVGIRAVSFLVMLFLLFHGAGLVLADAESGRAAFDLTAPLSRRRYLAGRSAGVLVLVVLFWATALAFFELLLLVKFGSVRAGLPAGAAVILLAQLLFFGVLLLFRLFLGGSWGAMGALLVWIGSAILSLDVLETSLFAVSIPEEASPWWLPMLRPFLGGEPIGWKADLARAVVRFFPPIGNVQSVGADLAAGKPVFPSLDWWSLLAAFLWGGIVWGASFRLFERRDW